MSYAPPKPALENAAKLMRAGATCQLSTGLDARTIQALSERGVPVVRALSLTPQFSTSSAAIKCKGATKSSRT